MDRRASLVIVSLTLLAGMGSALAETPAERGAYLAGTVGHCMVCHTPDAADGKPDANKLGAGGTEFTGPWGTVTAANITPSYLATWSDDNIKTAITTGVRPNGKVLKGPMPFANYARMKPEDLDAIVAYLRTLKRAF